LTASRLAGALEFLLSSVYDGMSLHPEHLADLRKSGLTDETIATHRIRSVPPDMIRPLLGFEPPGVEHAYVIPFHDPAGGVFDYVKLKVFGSASNGDVRGDQIEESRDGWRYNGGQRKYLVRHRAAPRLFFTIPTIPQVLDSAEPLWCVEGMKKALAVAQLGLPAIGIESAWSWHEKGSRALLPDFLRIPLRGRVVEVLPDSDAATNPAIGHAMRQLADALRSIGARPRLVRLPEAIPA
jgi:hypothetical protein